MSRVFIFLNLLLVLASVYSTSIPTLDLSSIPEEYRDMVPAEVTSFYNELTDEDKQILKGIAARHDEFQTDEEALNALKEKSGKLYTKAAELRTLVKERINALNPTAKEFVDIIIAKLKALRPKKDEKPNLTELRKEANEIIEKYKALPEDAKESLKTNFPKITGVIQNEKFQKLAQSLLKPEGAAAPA
jgi:DNA repair exonuclease SbcCD ATPase subunit